MSPIARPLPADAERAPSAPSPAISWGAEVRETHSGIVVLVGDRAFKVKKPVDLGFLDFSTVEKRGRACHREHDLNRRLAPDVYLGVAQVLDPDGAVCEHVLVMRRMPDDRRLATLATLAMDGVDLASQVRAIARLLASFHASARTGGEVDACGSATALAGRWRDNLDTLRSLGPRLVSRDRLAAIGRLVDDFVDGCAPLLERRVAAHLVRDGHGDLLADDIFCLPDGPRVLDCLDFDDRLRWMDVLDDVACLAMDLEHLGRDDLSDQLLRDYAEFSGAPQPAALAHHYVAYRAVMRAKVTAFRETRPGEEGRRAQEEVERLCRLGERHLASGRRHLVLVGGVPGSGKSTVGAGLADAVSGVLLSSDRTRKELVGIPAGTHVPAAFGSGIYSSELTEATYAALARRAEALLGSGESVVVDASFTRDRDRQSLRDVGRRARAEVVELRCTAPPDVLHRRLAARRRRPDAVSDADEAISRRLAAATDPWPQAHDVDTTRPVADSTSAVVHRMEHS